MECKQCVLKTTSKTILNNQIETVHKEQHKQQNQEMRKCFTCDKCDYKTTSKKFSPFIQNQSMETKK